MKSFKIILLLLSCLLILTQTAVALPEVSSGYSIEPYVSGLQNPTALAFSPGGTFGYEGELFVADSRPNGTIYRITSARNIIQFGTPRQWEIFSIAFPPLDSPFEKRLYVNIHSDMVAFDSSGVEHYFVDLNPFPWDLAFAPNKLFRNNLFQADSWEVVADGEAVREWAPDGTRYNLVTNLPEAVTGLAFGPGGDWGTDLYAVFTAMRGSTPAIRKVTPDGKITDFIILWDHPGANNLAFDKTGRFGGKLFVSDYTQDIVFQVDASGNISVFANNFSFTKPKDGFNGEGTGDLVFGPDGALYIADGGAGTVWRIAPASPPESLEILGPDQAAENATAQYQAIVHYEDGSSRDVTTTANWLVIPNTYAVIDAVGLLTVSDIEMHENVTVSAQYEEAGITVSAELPVILYGICPTGYALQFDGVNDYIQVTRTELLEPEEISIEMWVLLSDNQTRNTRLIRKAGHFGNGYLFAADQDNDKRLQLRIDNNGLVRAEDNQSHQAYVGSWHHFAGVYSKTTAAFYVDGVQVKNVTHNKGAMSHNPLTDLFIGCGLPSLDQNEFFKGKLDEIRIWNIPLNPQDIQSRMHLKLNGDEPGLVAYWNFDEGQGQVVYDQSPNGNDGRLGSTDQPDDSDPTWVESDAPVGVCSPYLIAVLNIKDAREAKLAVIDAIDTAIEKELTAIRALGDLIKKPQREGDPQNNIVQARNRIRTAIVQQKIGKGAIQKSIRELDRALELLNIETDTPDWPDIPDPDSANPADINLDGQVNILDLSLIMENWLATP